MAIETTPKGRSEVHINGRNEKLAARFYWYSVVIGLKFSRCLEQLEPEFDITQSRICDLLSEISDTVIIFERKNISVQELKNKYPFMNWQYLPYTKSQNDVR